jgi:plastocyanin
MRTQPRLLIKKAIAPAAVATAVVFLAAACSSSPSSPSYGSATPNTSSPSAAGSRTPKASQAANAATLTISGFAFSGLTVKPGQEVTVVNDDTAEHTVNLHGTDIDVTVPGSGEATFKAPTELGDYPLSCDFHSDMHGTLTVAK